MPSTVAVAAVPQCGKSRVTHHQDGGACVTNEQGERLAIDPVRNENGEVEKFIITGTGRLSPHSLKALVARLPE